MLELRFYDIYCIIVHQMPCYRKTGKMRMPIGLTGKPPRL